MNSNEKGKEAVSSDFPNCISDGFSDKPIHNRKNNDWWDLPTMSTLLELIYMQFQNR